MYWCPDTIIKETTKVSNWENDVQGGHYDAIGIGNVNGWPSKIYNFVWPSLMDLPIS